jgi:SRSO17 transposase
MVYLQGLFHQAQHKSAAHLAREAAAITDLKVADPVQALQHFINESPWDEQKLLRRQRALLADRFGTQDGVFVVYEVAFSKQGAHSVGVQRQYSQEYQKKLNCQIGVALHFVTPQTDFPLALRLYLPRAWLQTPERLKAAGVPPPFCQPLTKQQIAETLLNEIRLEGLFSGPVVWSGSQKQSLFALPSQMEQVSSLENAFSPLSAGERIQRARATWQFMKDGLGLDHFEGRSWRGFHHHTALVFLAYGFLLTQEAQPGPQEGPRP